MGRLGERIGLGLRAVSSGALLRVGVVSRRYIWQPLRTNWRAFVACALMLLVGLLMAVPWGCSPNSNSPEGALGSAGRLIRVRLMQGQDEVAIVASQPPVYTVGDSGEGTLKLPANAPV